MMAFVIFRRAPLRVISTFGEVDILSADKSSGHASGFDLAILDEIGLLHERDRPFVAGLRSATSARDGRFMALSIVGDGPFVPEILARKDDPAVAVHHYAAPDGCDVDDPDAWAAANPGIAAGIKSAAYMADEARRVLAAPADQPLFRAHELNQPAELVREVLVELADWKRCTVSSVAELPPADGLPVLGFDLGGSRSMTAACAIWPNGRVQTWAAFPGIPDLAARGAADGVGGLYGEMFRRGELRVAGGRVADVEAFLAGVAAEVGPVSAAGADRYRKAEAMQALDAAGVRWPLVWRGTGANKTADGSHDVRAFRNAVIAGDLRCVQSLAMASALTDATVRCDVAGNPALDKARSNSRTDLAQAAVIAAGLRALRRDTGRAVVVLH